MLNALFSVGKPQIYMKVGSLLNKGVDNKLIGNYFLHIKTKGIYLWTTSKRSTWDLQSVLSISETEVKGESM